MAIPALKFVTGKRASNTYVFLLAHFEITMLNSRLRQP